MKSGAPAVWWHGAHRCVRRLLAPLLLVGGFVVADVAGAQVLILRSVPERDDLNRNRVGIATGAPGGTYLPMGVDIATLVEAAAPKLRVVVQYGRGSLGNLDDLRNLRYVDLAIVQGDVLESLRQSPEVYRELAERIRYVTRLHREEVHVLARGNRVVTAADLNGKRLAVGVAGGGSEVTAKNLMRELGLTPTLVNMTNDRALADLKTGAIDAMLYVAGRPVDLFNKIPGEDIRTGELHFVPLRVRAGSLYLPTVLNADDYEHLVGSNDAVETVSVPAVLAVFAWQPNHDERYPPVKTFVEAFLANARRLAEPGFRRNWCDVDLAATIPGWRRSEIVEAWTAGNPDRLGRLCPTVAGAAAGPDCPAFLAAIRAAGVAPDRLPPSELAETYRRWQDRNPTACRS